VFCHCEEPFDYAQGKLRDEAISNATEEIATAYKTGLAMTKNNVKKAV